MKSLASKTKPLVALAMEHNSTKPELTEIPGVFAGNPDHWASLRRGYESWNALRKQIVFEPDLKGANLTGMDLRYYDLTKADFTGATLAGVNFEEAIITGANFTLAIALTRHAMDGAYYDEYGKPPLLPSSVSDPKSDATAGFRLLKEKLAADIQTPTQEQTDSLQTAQRIMRNRRAIILAAGSILAQINDFREDIRGNNELETELRLSLLSFLDRIYADISGLIECIPLGDERIEVPQAREVITRFNRFRSAFKEEIGGYIAVESLAKAAVPAGLILGCGAFGGLVGGPVGFGAGSLFGQLVTGQLKAGAIAKKIEGSLSDD